MSGPTAHLVLGRCHQLFHGLNSQRYQKTYALANEHETQNGNLEILLGKGKCFGGGYLEGQGDLVSRVITGIIRVTIWVIGLINLLTKSP